jgi:hypothetical protein
MRGTRENSTYEASRRILPSRSSMVAEARALRPLASIRCVLIMMNCSKSNRINLGLGTEEKDRGTLPDRHGWARDN